MAGMSFLYYSIAGCFFMACMTLPVVWLIRRSRDKPAPRVLEIIEACKCNPPEFPQRMYFTGRELIEKSLIGSVVGSYYDSDDDCTYIAFKRSLVSGIEVFSGRDIRTDDYEILLPGMIFSPKINGIYHIADETYNPPKEKYYDNEYSYDLPEAQDDLMMISQKSINTSPYHQKELEKNQMFTNKPEEVNHGFENTNYAEN